MKILGVFLGKALADTGEEMSAVKTLQEVGTCH